MALRNIILILGLVFAMAIAMGWEHANEDLYMALCSGRDTAQGHLGQPDYWSYVTQGEIWVNQGWAAGLIFYLSFLACSELGPVLIKGVLLTLTLALCFWKCHRLGIDHGACLCSLIIGLLALAPHLSIIAENFGVLYLILASSLLTMPVSYGPIRKWGYLLVVLLWSNSHGSFMIGWAMIWIKVACLVVRAVVLRYGPAFHWSPPEEHRAAHGSPGEAEPCLAVCNGQDYVQEIRGWVWVAAGSLLVMAFANPYGLDNLIMPFRQSASGTWTREVIFWSPLIDASKTKGLVLYKGASSVPFLIQLLVVASLLCIVLVIQRREISFSYLKRPHNKNDEDLLTEVTNTLFLVVIACRYGRAIVFTAPALIPLTGYLLSQSLTFLRAWASRRDDSTRPILGNLSLLTAVLLTGFVVFWFRVEILPSYLPSNPFVRAQTLPKKILGSFSNGLKGLTDFLTMNHINGRICASWQLADVLLWEVPGVEIFIDLRAQSLYSDEIRQEYNAIFRVDPNSPSSVARALSLLDSRQVQAVAIDKRLESSRLPIVLSTSRRWVPIYHDESTLLYVRSDSREATCLLSDGSTNCLLYPDPATRALSLATSRLETGKVLSPQIEEELRASVVNHPSALAYKSLCIAARRRSGSLTPNTQEYLWSEFGRLEKLNYGRPGGYAILASRVEILDQLKKAGYFSTSEKHTAEYRRAKEDLTKQMHGVWSLYLPWTRLPGWGITFSFLQTGNIVKITYHAGRIFLCGDHMYQRRVQTP